MHSHFLLPACPCFVCSNNRRFQPLSYTAVPTQRLLYNKPIYYRAVPFGPQQAAAYQWSLTIIIVMRNLKCQIKSELKQLNLASVRYVWLSENVQTNTLSVQWSKLSLALA